MVNPVQRPASTVGLLEPQAPLWAQRMLLRLLDYFKPENPTHPITVWRVATKTDLPPAADWPACMAFVVDIGQPVIAVGAAWQKLTLGGPV